MASYEHRCEILPVRAGHGRGCTAEILDGFAREGWELSHAHEVAVETRSKLDVAGQAVEMGLFVVLRRVKA